MVLYINTQDKDLIVVSLKKNGQIIKSLNKQNEFGSQVLLPLIMKLLSTENCELKTLTAIEVETGPGSFTGLRVGAAVANAIGFTLNIKVNGKNLETDLKY